MPVIAQSSYREPRLLANGHLHSLYPFLFRKVHPIPYDRERIVTTDGDFLDCDWSKVGSDRLAIVTHGLEGSSRSRYVQTTVRHLNASGWDALAWNMRGCSGEPNLKPHWYHSGKSDDLERVFSHALFTRRYAHIALIGFSLGGNVTLKFLGEQGDSVAPLVSAAAVISVPCDLKCAVSRLRRPQNFLYNRFFMRLIAKKIASKKNLFPEVVATDRTLKPRSFEEYDGQYTVPLHGFASVDEYWEQSSSKRFIPGIRVPTLILNAKNDPLLGPNCYPEAEANAHQWVNLETPDGGGHVGFLQFGMNGVSWAEARIMNFLNSYSVSAEFTPFTAAI